MFDFKSQFFKSELIHLNNAGLQPICLAARDKINFWAQRFWKEGFRTDHDYMNEIKQTRVSLAKLIGCHREEIAFFTSTAGAINQVAFSLGLKTGDEVLMWDQEYSSHIYPWKEACDLAHARLITVPSGVNLETPVEKYMGFINDKTRVIAFSWVQFMSGARMNDLEKLIRFAKSKNIFVCVDAIQGLGLHEFDLWPYGVDAVVGGSHKWLMAPVGVGFLALRNEFVAKFKPRAVGSATYGTCDDPSDFACEPKKDASRFEPGSKQVLEITALGASVDFILKTGVKKIEQESIRLAKKLRLGLMDLGYDVVTPFEGDLIHSTPFINFKSCSENASHSNTELSKKLNAHHILHALRGPGVRLVPQAFNTDEEIEFVLDVLRVK